MNVKFLNPFVEAAYEVVLTETGVSLNRGELSLSKEAYVTDDVTVIISLIGRVVGNVFYSMNQTTAIAFASAILGEKLNEMDGLAQSGIAELGNVITGRATVKLSQAGYDANISPPTILQGQGAIISTLDFARVVVPLISPFGPLMIHLALREGQGARFNTGQSSFVESPTV
jgi:chemotaxis protein CheX